MRTLEGLNAVNRVPRRSLRTSAARLLRPDLNRRPPSRCAAGRDPRPVRPPRNATLSKHVVYATFENATRPGRREPDHVRYMGAWDRRLRPVASGLDRPHRSARRRAATGPAKRLRFAATAAPTPPLRDRVPAALSGPVDVGLPCGGDARSLQSEDARRFGRRTAGRNGVGSGRGSHHLTAAGPWPRASRSGRAFFVTCRVGTTQVHQWDDRCTRPPVGKKKTKLGPQPRRLRRVDAQAAPYCPARRRSTCGDGPSAQV